MEEESEAQNSEYVISGEQSQDRKPGTLIPDVCCVCVCVCVCSAMSDSLWPHGLQPARLLCPWDFRGKNTEWVAISLSRGSSWLRDWTRISCIGRWILYHRVIWEAPNTRYSAPKLYCFPEKRCQLKMVWFIYIFNGIHIFKNNTHNHSTLKMSRFPSFRT